MYIHTLVVVSCLGGVKGEVRRGFIELVAKVRASQLVLSVTLLHVTIARRKVKICGFSSGNWFFSAADLLSLLRLVKGGTQLCTCC